MNHRQYVYTKERRTFGRQCLFTNRNELLFSEPPHPEYAKEYILKNPVHRGTQLSMQMAVSECNTDNVQYTHHGMNHIEGGWPKDVNVNDEEQTLRHRKKIERDEIWGLQVPGLGRCVLKSVRQNNAVNIYEDYFEDSKVVDPPAHYKSHNIGIYRDQVTPGRPITHMSWSPTGRDRIVCSYTSLFFQNENEPMYSLIWDLENANKPEVALRGPAPIISAEWNPRDEHVIAGGLKIGTVATWDPRIGSKETLSSVRETSHRESVSSLCWLHSKTNTEFFSASSDSTVLFWDARILRRPTAAVVIDPERSESPERLRAHAISALEFEFTIPTRYMVGTELGSIFIGNRKAMVPSEALLATWKIMTGPIYDLVHNPIYVKFFLVIGEWCAKICVEECKESELIRTKNHPCELRCGTWSSGRCSLFFLGRVDGVLEYWDLLMSREKPIIEQQICKGPIWSLKSSEDGRLLAIGTDPGDIYVFELDEALTVSDRDDRNAVGALFERETRRIKLLEGRMREINLKIASEDAKRKRFEEQITKEKARETELLGYLDDVSLNDPFPEHISHNIVPPVESIGESFSRQIVQPQIADELSIKTADEKKNKSDAPGHDETGSISEDEDVKTLIQLQNTEQLFKKCIENEKYNRTQYNYMVVKTPFDFKFEKHLKQGKSEAPTPSFLTVQTHLLEGDQKIGRNQGSISNN